MLSVVDSNSTSEANETHAISNDFRRLKHRSQEDDSENFSFEFYEDKIFVSNSAYRDIEIVPTCGHGQRFISGNFA